MGGAFTTEVRSTVGGLIALLTVILLGAHRIDTTTAVMLLGAAAAWIGIVSKDAGKKGDE